MHTLTEVVGSDVQKKCDLAESVLVALQQHKPKQQSSLPTRIDHDAAAEKFIVSSLRHALQTLRSRHTGRYSHEDRVLHQSILAASSCKVPSGFIAAAGRVLGTDERGLSEARDRWAHYEARKEEAPFNQHEVTPNPYAFAEFVQEQ